MSMKDRTRLSASTLSKREQAFQIREDHLLDLVQELIDRDGFSEFSMEKLVRSCDVSKGTVYNHFSSKEDCLAGLCIRGMHTLKHLFEKAATFEGLYREKFLAFHFAYQLHHRMNPTLCLSVSTARTPAFAEKVSEERSRLIQELDSFMFLIVYGVLSEAQQQHEIVMPKHINQEMLSYLNWSLCYGINSLTMTGFDHATIKRMQSYNLPMVGANLLMDGLNIVPLSSEYPYEKTWEIFEQEFFKEEIQSFQKKVTEDDKSIKQESAS